MYKISSGYPAGPGQIVPKGHSTGLGQIVIDRTKKKKKYMLK